MTNYELLKRADPIEMERMIHAEYEYLEHIGKPKSSVEFIDWLLSEANEKTQEFVLMFPEFDDESLKELVERRKRKSQNENG